MSRDLQVIAVVHRLDVYNIQIIIVTRSAQSQQIYLPIRDGQCTTSGGAVDKHISLGGRSNIGWSSDRSFRNLPYHLLFAFLF
jgi:hypothetical protein